MRAHHLEPCDAVCLMKCRQPQSRTHTLCPILSRTLDSQAVWASLSTCTSAHIAETRHLAWYRLGRDIRHAAPAPEPAHSFGTGILWPCDRLVEVGARLRGPGNDDKVAASSSVQAGSSIGELGAARTRASPRQHSFYNPHRSRRPSLLSTDQPPCSLAAGASIDRHCGSTTWSHGDHRTRPSCTLECRSNVTLITT